MGNLFLNEGEKEFTDQFKLLRIGRVFAVNTDDATVSIRWLDKNGGHSRLPISMPYCESGWGILVMPNMNTNVVVGFRPYDLPVILAYLPPLHNPSRSYWKEYKHMANLPDITKGEIIIRNLINKAKCLSCKTVSTLADWSLNVEKCPKCNVPAAVLTGEIVSDINKIQMGISVHFKKDGNLSFQMNDGLSADDGDTNDSGSMLKVSCDNVGNIIITGVRNSTTNIGENFTTNSKNVIMNCESLKENVSKNKEVVIEGNLDVTAKGGVYLSGGGDSTQLNYVVVAVDLPGDADGKITSFDQLKIAKKVKAE